MRNSLIKPFKRKNILSAIKLRSKFVLSASIIPVLFLFGNSISSVPAHNINKSYSLDTLFESSDDDTLIISDSLNYEGTEDSLVAEVEDINVFIDSTKNVIGNASAISRFYSKVCNTADIHNTVSIYHIGDSHIAGKSYPNSIAKHLESDFTSVSTVIITPRVSVRRRRIKSSMIKNAKRSRGYKGKKSNSSKKKKSSSAKTGSQTSVPVNGFQQRLLAENIFENTGSMYSIPNLQCDVLTQPSGSYLYNTNDKSDVNCKYTAYGVSGRSFQYFVDSPNTIKHLDQFEPDLVIISLGVNDIFGKRFEEERILNSLTKLVTLVRSHRPGADILLGISGDAFLKQGKTNPFLPRLKALMVKYAIHNNCAYWDPVPVFGGYGYMGKWLKHKLCGVDRIHCTPAGYTLMGDMLVQAIDKGLNNYMQAK